MIAKASDKCQIDKDLKSLELWEGKWLLEFNVKNIRGFPVMGKIKIIGGDGGQIWGGCTPIPPGICSPSICQHKHT